MSKLVALAIGVLLAMQAHAHFPVSAVLSPEATKEYLEIACSYTGGECPALPYVVSTPTQKGLWGFHYRGDDTVYITDRCSSGQADPVKCEAVIVHELVHYIVSEQGRYDPAVSSMARCHNEALAWAVYNRFVLSKGRPDLYIRHWRLGYPQCLSNGKSTR